MFRESSTVSGLLEFMLNWHELKPVAVWRMGKIYGLLGKMVTSDVKHT